MTQVVVGEYTNTGTQTFTGAPSGHRTEFYTATGALHLYSTPNDIADGSPYGAKHVFAAVANGASSAVYVDDSQNANATGTAGDSWNAIEVGATLGGNNLLNGKVAEIITYSRALSASERKTLFAYLGARYGIATS
jgi:hypothetical protein